MLNFMMQAQVGDDVFREDPTVRHLEEKMAQTFGKEAGLFCPSGTMANQIAIKVHTRPLDEVICDIHSHIYQYEVGGYAFHSGVSILLLEGDHGRINAEQIEQSVRPDFDWLPKSRLVVLENTANRAGGTYYDIQEVKRIRSACKKHGLFLHLDGARIFNALVATGEKPQDWGTLFDSISVCLSKGLGAPVGTVLLGDETFIREARRVRKVMGGGMRQIGYLAAAGIYALDHHIARLKDDHDHAQLLYQALLDSPVVTHIRPVMTNIVIFDVLPPLNAAAYLSMLKEAGIQSGGFGPQTIRFVTHLDVTRKEIEKVCETIRSIC